jgi:hypothetical protein
MRKLPSPASVFQGYDVHQQVVHLIVDVDRLVLLPLSDCPFLQLLEAETVRLLDHDVEFVARVLVRPSLYNASKGIDTARARSIRVDRAPRFANKGTTQVFVLLHLEGDYWQTGSWAYVVRGIAFQEFSGGELQPLFKTENIVRGQALIKVAATAIKTLDIRVARKSEGVIQGKSLKICHYS